MMLEDLRESLIDTADLVHPNLQSLKNDYISIEDMVDYIIYEGIKAAYDNYAEKKSIRQHMIDNDMDTDTDRRKLSRKFQYAQYYRDAQQARLLEKGFSIKELSGKNMDDFSKRMEGHEITGMNFLELRNMMDIPLLEKIISRKIGSSKIVSNTQFTELMNEYDSYINSLQDDLNTPDKMVYNTDVFFTLEWKYNVDIIYDIVLAAEERGYPEFKVESVRWTVGEINIQSTTDWYPGSISTECRMINKRGDFLPLIFKDGTAEFIQFEYVNAELYRLREVIRFLPHRKSIAELVHQTSMEDRASFIKNRFWIWDRHHRNKEWTPNRIKYARKIYDYLYLVHEPPKIK